MRSKKEERRTEGTRPYVCVRAEVRRRLKRDDAGSREREGSRAIRSLRAKERVGESVGVSES